MIKAKDEVEEVLGQLDIPLSAAQRLTEKRTLLALGGLQSAPFGHVAAWEVWNQTPRQPAGHYGKWPNWANVLEQPPARLRGGLRRGPAGLGLGPGLTEKRSLGRGPR